jgi:hypothetical protein
VIFTMPFTPPSVNRPGSHRPEEKPPRWWRPGVLADVVERSNRLYVVFSKSHPALRDLDEVYCGIEGEVGTAAAVERAFREAQRIKRAWKAEKKAAQQERIPLTPAEHST